VDLHFCPGEAEAMRLGRDLEAANQQAVEFGEQRLVHSAQGTDGSAQLIQKKIMDDVTSFCTSNFHDDATLLVVAIR